MSSRTSGHTSWRGKARLAFGLSNEGARSETIPLLQQQQPSARVGSGSYGGYAQQEQYRRKAKAEHWVSPEDEDAIEELEKLPALLARSVLFFTLAICSSTLLGAIKVAFLSNVSTEACLVPVAIAAFWLAFRLVVSAIRIRRVMRGEEMRRKEWIYKIRRRMRRRHESRGQNAEVEIGSDSSRSPSSTPPPERRRSQPGSSTAGARRGRARGEVPETAAAAAGAMAAAVKGGGKEEEGGGRGEDIERPPSSPAQKRWRLPPSTSAVEGAPRKDERAYENERRRMWQERARENRTQRGQEAKPSIGATAAAAASTPRAATSPGTMELPKPSLAGNAPPCEQDVGEPTTMAELSSRAVRVSYLLQGWFRLWLSLAFFAAVVVALMVLVLIQLCPMPIDFSAIALASPIFVALAVMTLQSFLMLDGDGGSAGGLAIRGRGVIRTFLSLGRRPIIALTDLCVVIVMVKLNAVERLADGRELSFVGTWAAEASWPLVLLPYWVATVLIQAVYARALLESYTHENFSSTLFGDRTLGFLLCCRGDADDAGRCPGSLRGGGDRFYSSIRRRAELTPSQRTAAGYLVGGMLMLTVSVSAISNRIQARPTSSWGFPLTILVATLGFAMIGSGLWWLASAYHRSIRGGLPPPAKPLPVFFSERQGGWVVGPADPPKVVVFLLGEVTLRQEGFAPGGGGVERRDSVTCSEPRKRLLR